MDEIQSKIDNIISLLSCSNINHEIILEKNIINKDAILSIFDDFKYSNSNNYNNELIYI